MKLLALIYILLISSLMATDDLERLYPERIRRAEQETQELQEKIKFTLGAKADVANDILQEIHKKLEQLLTAPPSTLDAFREEFVPLLKFILSPEQFFSESEARALITSLSTDNLRPLDKGPAPLKLCYEKWNAIVAHAEIIILAVKQTVWFHDEWDEFASRIVTKISTFEVLTPEETLNVFDKFLYFYNQLARFERSERTLNKELRKTGATLPGTLTYLSAIQKDLIVLYQKRSKILWEILSETINVAGKPESFDAIPEDYFLDKRNPIRKFLLDLTTPRPNVETSSLFLGTPNVSRTESHTEESFSESPPQQRPLPNAGSLSTISITDLSSAPKSVGSDSLISESPSDTQSLRSLDSAFSDASLSTDTYSLTPLHSDSNLVSGSGASTPKIFRSASSLTNPLPKRAPLSTPERLLTPQERRSTPQEGSLVSPLPQRSLKKILARGDGILQREREQPSIEMFSDGSVQNTNTVAKFKEAFAQPPEWATKVKDFGLNIKYLKNVKFVLRPLKELFETYEGFREKLIYSSNRIKEFLTPSARIRMPDQPSARISQSFAYRICSLLSSGPLCFGLRDNAERIAIDLIQKIDNLTFSVKEDNPFRVGSKLALYELQALLDIPCEPSTFIVVDDMEVLALESTFRSGTRPQVNACKSYLQDSSSCKATHKYEFVMAQQINSNLSLNAWLQQVLSGQRPFDELCPFSYGITTLFTILTRSKAMDNNFVVEAHEDKVRLKRVGFDLFLDPSFQDYKGNHLFVGGNVFLHLPYAKQKIPEDVKQHFRRNSIELICAYWETYLQNLQLYFNKLIIQYKLEETPDPFGVESGIEGYTQVIGQGLTMSRLRDTIPFLISTYHRMLELLDKPDITYLEVLDNLRPYEAVIVEIFKARANKRLERELLEKFFKVLIPTKIAQLEKVISQMRVLGETAPYSAEEIGLIKETASKCCGKLPLSSWQELLPQSLNPRVLQYFQQKYEWAVRTGFFETAVGEKSYELITDGGNDLYLYEDLIKEHTGEAPNISWASIPVMRYGLPDNEPNYISEYLISVTETTHPVAGMVQDLFEADISKMQASSALKFADLLLSINAQPARHHPSWALRLIEIAERNYFSISPNVLAFIEGLGFDINRQRLAMELAHLQRFKDCELCLGDVGGKLKAQSRPMLSLEEQPRLDIEATLPGYLLRQLLMAPKGLGYTQKEVLVLLGICDLLLFTPYSSVEEISDEIGSDPGCLGLASNPIGRRGIWELHPSVGDHYLLCLSEVCAILFRSPDFVSEKVRSVLRSAPLPLFCLQWLQAQRTFGLNTQFHPWFPKSLIDKLKLLQQLMTSHQPLTFNDICLALARDLHLVLTKEFKTQASRANEDERVIQTPEEKEAKICKEVLRVLRGIESQKDQLHIARKDRKDLKNLTPIEGKDVNLERVQPHLDQWDEVYEAAASTSPLSLDEVATQALYELNPADYGTEIISRTLFLAAQFTINPTRINRELWRSPQIIEDLLKVEAPLECIQLAATLRAGKPISITKPSKISFAVSGTEDDVEFLCELVSLFPKMAYLHPGSRETVLMELGIPYNGLRSLLGVMPTLLKFPGLVSLNIRNNPIHNITLLRKLTQLEALDVSNTCIHLAKPLTRVDQLLTLFMEGKLTPDCQDLRRLIDQTFLHTLSNLRLGKEEVDIDNFLGTKEAQTLIPLPKLVRIVNDKDEECSRREAQLMEEPAALWSKLEGLLGSPENKDMIIILLEHLSEQQFPRMLDCCPIIKQKKTTNHVIEQVTALLQDLCFHPRLYTSKLLYALIFGLPIGTNPYSLTITPRDFQCTSLRRLEIVNTKVDSVFLGGLGQFTNLQYLILFNNNQPDILSRLPRLPNLVELVIKGNKLTSLLGLVDSDRAQKFTNNLTTLVLMDNLLTDDSHIMLILNLLKLEVIDLSNNCLKELPQLGNLQHLTYQDYRHNLISIEKLKGLKNSLSSKKTLLVTPQKII